MGTSLVLFPHLYLLFFCLVNLGSSDLPASVSLAIFHLLSTRALKSPGHELSFILCNIPYKKKTSVLLEPASATAAQMKKQYHSTVEVNLIRQIDKYLSALNKKKSKKKSQVIPYYIYYIKSSKLNGIAFSLNHCLTLQVY